eukprot:COSAG02_NODE_7030_length_3220_cov_2.913810_1_plen_171_part_00
MSEDHSDLHDVIFWKGGFLFLNLGDSTVQRSTAHATQPWRRIGVHGLAATPTTTLASVPMMNSTQKVPQLPPYRLVQRCARTHHKQLLCANAAVGQALSSSVSFQRPCTMGLTPCAPYNIAASYAGRARRRRRHRHPVVHVHRVHVVAPRHRHRHLSHSSSFEKKYRWQQ